MKKDRKLSPKERLAVRIGYMGTGLLIAGQWTLEPILFVIGFICITIQVAFRRQWNLVALQWYLAVVHLFMGENHLKN